MTPESSDWHTERSAAAAELLARLNARQRQEGEQAQAMLDVFVIAARKRGLEPEPLRVRGYRGSESARTNLRGWYLRKDRKAGVDTSGAFYLLSAPLTIRERLTGVQPTPSTPPLVLGAGGRDGDSVALGDALERLLPAWDRDRIDPCQE